MDTWVHLIASLPPVAAAAVVLVQLVVRAVGRVCDRIEDRRGLEIAVRGTRPTDRADIVRAYAEAIGAARKRPGRHQQRCPGSPANCLTVARCVAEITRDGPGRLGSLCLARIGYAMATETPKDS
jgi:hypothetical protein